MLQDDGSYILTSSFLRKVAQINQLQIQRNQRTHFLAAAVSAPTGEVTGPVLSVELF